MASVEWWKVLCCVLFVTIRDIRTEHYLDENLNVLTAAPEFARYSVFKPKIYHGREKREISSTRMDREGLQHIHDIILMVSINGKDQVLDLRLNRELLHKNYFIRHQQNGSHTVHNPEKQDVELCHYRGKLRGVENSWAAISTCRGIRGMIYDGESLHYVERTGGGGNGGDDDNHIIKTDHFLYSHEDLNTNHSCGYSGTHINVNKDINRIHRYKRSAEVIRGPYNANRQSRFVELVLVVDNKEYKALGEDINRVNSHCKDIANIINALYVPLNIFIALIGVVVWTEFDEISLSTNGDTTLTNFLHYRRQHLVKEHPNDNAQLLTRIKFDGGVVGKALKGPICTFEFSGGVSMDHSNVVGLVATTVAHEMGHNFGMEHDDNDCQCPDDRCIMAPSSSSMSPVHWSSCSLEYLALAFEHGMDYCLRNKPERLFDSPVCGNGYVEIGEQCDCGLKEYCDNPCCNATTCMLYSNASCATGECCDLQTCRPKTAGSVCRSADHECDLPEFCTGQSEFCPEDVFKMDGEKCDRGKAFCYQGSCRTHSDQCKLLWGPSGKSSDTQCYKMNKKGSRHGNCGYNRLNQSYIKCDDGDIYCGMLHCMHLNERLEFGMESVAILSHSYINSGGSIIPCRTAIVDLGLNQVDPGLAPDGAKCGEGKMCVNQKCMPVESLQASASLGGCPQQCNNNGVCNSRGHCHCRTGFAPPFCDYPGTGGSEDSGPASDPNARKEVIAALYIVFLGIVPFVAFVSLFVYYMRRNPVFWRKKPRVPTAEKKSGPGHPRTPRHDSSSNKGPGSGGMVSSDHTRALLLSRPETTSIPSSDGSPVASSIQNNLLGHFKGFSITPISKPPAGTAATTTATTTSATASANLIPTRPAPPVNTQRNQPVSPPKVPSVSIAYPTRSAPKPPPGNIGLAINNSNPVVSSSAAVTNLVPSRPDISSPVLDTTTSCTAKELIDTTGKPVRPAPSVPRPVSTSVVHDVGNIDAKQVKSSKDSSYPTLTRIASFMRGQKGNQENKKDVLKSGKIDKDALRNLEISNPIPQKEIEVPSSALPAGDKVVVMRAQSLRNTSTEKRPPIPSFGSMRIPNSKRPTSIPVSGRPTSPPPPRPPSTIGVPGYQTPGKVDSMYDDCLNILTEGTAPLANIDEESPSSPVDNIYAVIEESPTDRRERKEIILPKKLEYTSPTGDYKSPKAIESSVSAGSGESMGLLGEIVSEIEARNTDSIYSTSTLKRKQKERDKYDDETSSTVTDVSSEVDKNQTYVNTSWKPGYSNIAGTSASSSSSSSGYLSPINPNQGNKSTDISSKTDESSRTGVKVPETSAPSYKPYLQRHMGPLSSSFSNKKTTPESSAPVHIKTQLTRTKTPPSAQTSSENKLSHRNNTVKKSETSNQRHNNARKDNESLSLTKPDLVSSCSPSAVKSPDVLGGKDDIKSPPYSGRTIENKPAVAKPTTSFRGRQPLPAPKPTVIPNPSKPNSITNQPLPAIPTTSSSTKTKPIVTRTQSEKTNTVKTVPSIAKQVNANKSNVASLQQKFETNKQPLSSRSLSTRPTVGVKSNSTASDSHKNFNVKR